MIKSVEITFDFGKLAKKMPEILKNYGSPKRCRRC